MRLHALLALAVVASVVVLSGSVLAVDYAISKTPALSRVVETIPDKRLSVVDPVPIAQGGEVYYLLGNLEDIRGVVQTDAGSQEAAFKGEIGFKVTQSKDGQKTFVLESLNLLSNGVQTAKGSSGVIGIVLDNPGSEAKYDRESSKASSEVQAVLHYDLIDEVMGFIREKSEECAVFTSYTETMKGTMELQLPREFKMADQGEVSLKGEIRLDTDSTVLGAIKNTYVKIDLAKFYWYITKPALILKVQPVYIGTGAGDPAATGTALSTLLSGAVDIWSRCGTVRCVTIRANDPIYINNNAYKVLTSYDTDPAECNALRGSVNIADAVEIFVVDHWDPLFDGGGACWSSGTASAKIVTCDQQLNVPCPPPAGGSCGAVNMYHLAHELGHALSLGHPGAPGGLIDATMGSIMEPSGFYRDNPNVQSAKNCRSATNPLLYWGRTICTKSPDIMD